MTSLDKPTPDTDQPRHRRTGRDRPAGGTQQDAEAKAVTEAALFDAFGGVRGMVETVLPGLLFVTIFTINCPGETADSTFSPIALSFTLSVNSFAIL